MSEKQRLTKDEIVSSACVFVRQARRVRFQDVDAAGTIYFPRVLEYMADAYVEILEAAGIDLPRVLGDKQWAGPLVHAEADYLAALRFGDAVEVELVIAQLGKTSATFGYRIRKGDEIASVGQTVHVFVDGKTFRPVEVPPSLRALIRDRGPSSSSPD